MANVASILSRAYRLTNTNSSTLLDGNSTNVLADLNSLYGHRTLKILGVRQDLNYAIEESYTDIKSITGLSAGDNGYNGEYAFPTDLLRPVRIEVSYDGLTWRPCEIYDINENSNSEFDDVNGSFSTAIPYVRFERDSYFVRPLPTTNVTNGIHIWYEKRQTDMTSGSPDFETNLHDILAYDLAELEILMHPDRYDQNWKSSFYKKKQDAEDDFNTFFKNQFKRNFRLKSKQENYK
jgi:hypothetical protein